MTRNIVLLKRRGRRRRWHVAQVRGATAADARLTVTVARHVGGKVCETGGEVARRAWRHHRRRRPQRHTRRRLNAHFQRLNAFHRVDFLQNEQYRVLGIPETKQRI